MPCIPKPPSGLCTIIDLRQRNENTVKDITPFPDQDHICHDVVRAHYRSKIDMTDAYKQVRIVEKDIPKTGFYTIYGTFQSCVLLQQDDCNGLSMFQRLMTVIFRTETGLFIHIYLDDIFIFSATIDDHKCHLQVVLQRLRDTHYYLSEKNFDIYSKCMDCLECLIDKGLHANTDKMTLVRNWRVPQNYHDVQRFLGLINYLSPWMPYVSAYTTPLSGMCAKNHAFIWQAWHQSCFDTIKALACHALILKPVDFTSGVPVWVITDSSLSWGLLWPGPDMGYC